MPVDVLIPFLAVFGFVALAVLGVWLLVAWRVEKRRQFLAHRMGTEDAIEAPLIVPPDPSTWSGRFDIAFSRLMERTRLDIDPLASSGIVLLAGVLTAGIVFVWRAEEEPWLALPAFILGVAGALGFFWWRNRAWRRVVRNQLPDAIFLLARALRAGRSLEQAFELVGEQGVAPISREFARMCRQMGLGLSLTQVLEITAQRLDVVDFNVFAAVLALHRPSGGNLPAILDRLGSSTRDRLHFESQYRAATIMGRISAGFITLMVGVILVYFFFYQRDLVARFFESSTGIMLFVSALLLQVIGGLMLYWFLRFDV